MTNSCLTLAAQCDGRDVTTIEGLAPDGRLHPVTSAAAVVVVVVVYEGVQREPAALRLLRPAASSIRCWFGDDLIPAHGDVPNIDVVFVGAPDPVRPLGIKGVGEIAVVGVSAAIANAVSHATGRRIRSLPITVEQLL